jgi:predicted transcriptional regulator
VQAQPDDQARVARIAIAAAKTQFVIKEQKIRQSNDLPAAQQAAGDLTIRFGALGLDVNLMAAKIDDIE